MKKLIALLASLSVLSAMPASFASALFFEDIYEYREVTDGHYGENGHTMDLNRKIGQYEKEGSYFDGCDMYYKEYSSEYTYPEDSGINSTPVNYAYDYIVVPANKIEAFYLNVTGDPYVQQGADRPLNVDAYDYRIELDLNFDSDFYTVDMYDSTGLECKVMSDSDASPIDFDKLNEIAPEIKCEWSKSKNTEQGYETTYSFYTEHQYPGIDNTFRNYEISEENRDKILSCANEHMISFKSSHHYFYHKYYVEKHHIVEDKNLEKAKAIYDKYGISFTTVDYVEYYGIDKIDWYYGYVNIEEAGDKSVLIPDEPLEGIEFFEILCQFADEGIATKSVKDPTALARYYYEPEVELVANVKGDANDDSKLALSDSVIILQNIGNPDEYRLSTQGRYNADIAGNKDGITNLDALTIQRKLLKLE